MPITVVCPACQKRSNSPDVLAGKARSARVAAACWSCRRPIVSRYAQVVAVRPVAAATGAPLAVGKPVAQPWRTGPNRQSARRPSRRSQAGPSDRHPGRYKQAGSGPTDGATSAKDRSN